MSPLDAKTQESLVHLMLGCCLYRLGGEQSFTIQDIEDIKSVVGGVQVLVTDDDTLIVRARTHEAYKNLADKLKGLGDHE